MEELTFIKTHLPEFGAEQLEKLGRLLELVREWNDRVNLVSRKDIENLEVHHLLHSLAIVRVLHPTAGTRIADVGTGGGFPGLPLAILFPDCHFTLIDSIAKKGRVVEEMANALGLTNVRVITKRAEEVHDKFDFVLGRAVTALPKFLDWTAPLLVKGTANTLANGVLYFKGTRYREELAELKCQAPRVWLLNEIFPLPFFEDKFLLHFSAPVGIH